jgi:hypothetical protein
MLTIVQVNEDRDAADMLDITLNREYVSYVVHDPTINASQPPGAAAED